MIDNAKASSLPRSKENPPPGNQRRVLYLVAWRSGDVQSRANLLARLFKVSPLGHSAQTCPSAGATEVPLRRNTLMKLLCRAPSRLSCSVSFAVSRARRQQEAAPPQIALTDQQVQEAYVLGRRPRSTKINEKLQAEPDRRPRRSSMPSQESRLCQLRRIGTVSATSRGDAGHRSQDQEIRRPEPSIQARSTSRPARR